MAPPKWNDEDEPMTPSEAMKLFKTSKANIEYAYKRAMSNTDIPSDIDIEELNMERHKFYEARIALANSELSERIKKHRAYMDSKIHEASSSKEPRQQAAPDQDMRQVSSDLLLTPIGPQPREITIRDMANANLKNAFEFRQPRDTLRDAEMSLSQRRTPAGPSKVIDTEMANQSSANPSTSRQTQIIWTPSWARTPSQVALDNMFDLEPLDLEKEKRVSPATGSTMTMLTMDSLSERNGREAGVWDLRAIAETRA
jgi:hypothetical protein